MQNNTGDVLRTRAGRPTARATLRCLGYSATIAIAGCSSSSPPPPDRLHECVDLRNGETFRFKDSEIENHSTLFSTRLAVKDEQGFKREITSASPIKCRDASPRSSHDQP